LYCSIYLFNYQITIMQDLAICKPENFYSESFQFTGATFIMSLNFLLSMNFSIYFNNKSQIMTIKVSNVEFKLDAVGEMEILIDETF
jgi:hypothetical protein